MVFPHWSVPARKSEGYERWTGANALCGVRPSLLLASSSLAEAGADVRCSMDLTSAFRTKIRPCAWIMSSLSRILITQLVQLKGPVAVRKLRTWCPPVL